VATEIERKFLVKGFDWQPLARSVTIRQGYICSFADRGVRVRIAGERAFLTVKAAKNAASRFEYEYEIPIDDAAAMLDRLCERPLIEKRRHQLTFGGLEWVVDVFEGDNAGLVVAEVELEDEAQVFERPDWVGAEVTHEPRYLNANLGRHPFSAWAPAERGAATARP
jgi:adenylate cyclase